MCEQYNSLSLLPDDVSLVILSFLSVNDLSHMRLAQKSWSMFELTGHNLLWAPVFQSVVERPRYEFIRSSFLERVQSISNFREKVLVLKQVISDVIEQRKEAIRAVPPILDQPHHKYLGLTGVDEISAENLQVKKKHLDYIKVVVVGDCFIGKTYLQMRTVRNEFPEFYCPSVMESYCIETSMGGNKTTIYIWDTFGSDDYRRLRPLSYLGTHIFLMCFSVVDPSSFQNITMKWLFEIMDHCPEAIVMLVGTKIDLRENVLESITPEEGQCMAERQNCIFYIETSALTGQNLGEAFHDTLIKCALIGHKLRENSSSGKGKCILC